MKKHTFKKYLLILGTIIITPMVNANNVTISKINDNNLNLPGVKITKGVNRGNSIYKKGSSEDNFDYPNPPPAGFTGGQSGAPGGFTGAKEVSIPSAQPKGQTINGPVRGDIPQSFNDMEEKSKKISQGQIPFEPPTITQGNLQSWNTSTINEMEAKGISDTQQKYQQFRSGKR